ncbi:hypothetical protein DC008_01750 [Streptomyces nigra]|nr:hypothetical protein DC008_01750 [Streptomyces nigra]
MGGRGIGPVITDPGIARYQRHRQLVDELAGGDVIGIREPAGRELGQAVRAAVMAVRLAHGR